MKKTSFVNNVSSVHRIALPIRLSETKAKDFRGKWLALDDDQIVAYDEDIKKVITRAKKLIKGKLPKFVRIPNGNSAMY